MAMMKWAAMIVVLLIGLFMTCDECSKRITRLFGWYVILEKGDMGVSLGLDVDGDKESDVKIQIGDLFKE